MATAQKMKFSIKGFFSKYDQTAVLPKTEFTLELTEKSWFIHWKTCLVETSFQQNAGLEFIPAMFFKEDFTAGIFWHGTSF